jgi:(2Fe-2S) ferredoxin
MKDKAKKMGLKGIRINAAGCLDRCELGPTLVIYPDGIWYRFASESDVDEILETHIKNKGRVERLLLKPEDGPNKAEAKTNE